MNKPAFSDQLTTAITDNRRAHERVPGPFDGTRVGLLETPIRIFDLSIGGCFVNALHEQEKGVICTIKIELPEEGWIKITGETLYRRPGYGFALRFVEMTDVTRKRLERALARLSKSRSDYNQSASGDGSGLQQAST